VTSAAISALTLTDIVIGLLVAGSVFFTAVGALGLLRLPDLYTRAHAASKADTLGAGFGIAAVMISFGIGTASLKAAFLLVFVYVTAPTAAHAISRAAYDQGIEPWEDEEE